MAQTREYRPSQKRSFYVLNFLGVGLCLLIFRLYQVQIIKRAHYIDEIAPKLRSQKQALPPQPGALLARDKQLLAESLLLHHLVADPQQMAKCGENFHSVAEQLAVVLRQPQELIHQRLSKAYKRGRRDVELARFVPDKTVEKIDQLNISGLYFRPAWKRQYAYGKTLCHVIGARNRFHYPLHGLEYHYRGLLDSLPGADVDTGEFSYSSTGARPQRGKNVQLTIDLNLQMQVERELDGLWAKEHPRWAYAIVLDPRTGEILAMGTRPAYDPNLYVGKQPGPDAPSLERVTPLATNNIPVTEAFEPGSTFKVLLIAAALEAGVVTPQTCFHCKGSLQIGKGKSISCWGKYATQGHGTLDMYGMIAQSCNVIAAQVALRLGAERYCAFLRKVGIGEDPQAGFPAEACGKLYPPAQLRPRDVATMGYGQNVSCSGLQLVAAISGIVNNGIMMQPHIVKSVLNPDYSLFYEPNVTQKRICSPQTSYIVRQMLQYAVEHGTGAPARMSHVKVGGKTGTAQKWDPVHKCFLKDRYIVSFVEVVPIEAPHYVIYVACNEPKVGRHGSDVAAPVCRNLAAYVVQRMRQRLSRPDGAPLASAGTSVP